MTETNVRSLGATFFKGLAAVLPIVVTLYLIYWLAGLAEAVLGGILDRILPFYFPGLGIIFGVVGIFMVGVMLNAWVVRKLFDWGESIMHRIPLVKIMYGAVQDLMHFFTSSTASRGKQVVMITFYLGDVRTRLVGMITREDFESLPAGIAGPDEVAVYLPMSYQVGGYTVMVPRENLEPVDMSFDQAMRFAVTAGMSASKVFNKKPLSPDN